ncbi:twin-arginine translocase subunit TatC [Candidatus Woesearchaeota archaeon]|nr:twin-arginine translocase subunit TatC [Candidatus Woesearchaeota archaeon]
MKLSSYLKISVVMLVITLCFIFADTVIKFILSQLNVQIITKTPSDGFILYFQIALLMATIVLFPLITHQLINYVRPALYDHEKVTLNKFMRISYLISFLFILGVAFGYYMLFYIIIPFLSSFNTGIGITNIWNANETIIFVLSIMFYTGLTFQTPVIIYYMLKWELIDIKNIPLIRKSIIIVALIVGAVITPPDILSQVIFGLPIWILFEISVFYWRLKNGWKK